MSQRTNIRRPDEYFQQKNRRVRILPPGALRYDTGSPLQASPRGLPVPPVYLLVLSKEHAFISTLPSA